MSDELGNRIGAGSVQGFDVDPWDRRPGESDRAFECFRRFRDMPAHERSLIAVVRWLHGSPEPSAAQERSCRAWAARFGWEERVRAWDAHVDQRRRQASIEAAQALHGVHLEAARKLVRALDLSAERLLRKLEADPDAALTPSELSKMSATIAQLHDGAPAAPTQNSGGASGSEVVVRVRYSNHLEAEDVIRREGAILREHAALFDEPYNPRAADRHRPDRIPRTPASTEDSDGEFDDYDEVMDALIAQQQRVESGAEKTDRAGMVQLANPSERTPDDDDSFPHAAD